MSSKSKQSFAQRAKAHPNVLAKRLFEIAERKQTNIVLSADLTTTGELLKIADDLGPHIAVLKTHIDIVADFSSKTTEGLSRIAQKHDFLIFEDRKFIDIGNTVQKQYSGGALRIHEWAHIVNASVLPGPGVIQALDETILKEKVTDRAILILAEMTSKGSLAVGDYTRASVDIARQYAGSVVGFVCTKSLADIAPATAADEDFIIFTTGVNMANKGDALGQQYQTPITAMAGGSDFLIAGRGIYANRDPIAAAQEYRQAGWDAYISRIKAAE
ncbi:orotidine 5'-phosphate decarboxylase [Cyphellophora europaea CBS 101466]|uniref:Orotidine 5'-phosphate decarboxylase n=1 Tax=Cyphellophora europaea (strain CBS 101466) TaxID=1220924 RepID=W2RNV3_CYPE1|nr:orotidine 5'-phosphate decarboxylase [Cyphellophora europaea CBS 101466]ETN37384.1 orotidine 5'-phosphate decarboxylase [Cyphellophora europaea CBS 101466]